MGRRGSLAVVALGMVALVSATGCGDDADPAATDGGGSALAAGGSGGESPSGGFGGMPPMSDGSISFEVDGVAWVLSANASIAHHTQLELLRGWAGETASEDVNFFNFHAPSAVGDYECGDVRLTYKSETAQYRATDLHGDCVLAVETLGEVGELVTGTFSGTLLRFSSEDEAVEITNGRFEILRSSDR